ncbi:MAG: DUF3408 domain-containing protein [Alistipes sp.]|uniref:DUF3408 domain-containing protein n=1 Tax=Alistipes sp. TaxID=1872444 RepID=UPI0025C59FB9|nr:DUF3408 domain-containing protein [Alistipes sp.]MCD8273735.1 DUF3408 domain-containing protein [Alistipes sp.]
MYYDLLSELHLFGIPTLTALLLASLFIRRLPAFSLRQATMTTSSVLRPAVATETPAIRIPSAAACLKTMTKAASSGQGIAGTAHAKSGGETTVVKAPKSQQRTAAVPDFEQTFMKLVDIHLRAALYVSIETKRKILEVVKKIGGEYMTATSYVEHILRQHLELYKDDINRIHKEQNTKELL